MAGADATDAAPATAAPFRNSRRPTPWSFMCPPCAVLKRDMRRWPKMAHWQGDRQDEYREEAERRRGRSPPPLSEAIPDGTRMSKARPIKAWNILDCALSRGVSGHHHWEAKAFVDELVRRGEKVRLFTNLNAPDAAQYPGAELIPTFAMFLYQDISNDPMWSSIENFVVHNRSFHRALSHLDPSMFEDSVTVFPTLSENQVLGLVRWLATFPKEKRPRVAVGLRAPQEFTPSNTRLQFYRNVFTKFLSEQGPCIAAFSRTAQCAAMIEKHVGVKTNVFPFLAPDELLSRRPRAAAAGCKSHGGFVRRRCKTRTGRRALARNRQALRRVQACSSSFRCAAKPIPRSTPKSCARCLATRMCVFTTAR